MEERKTEGAKSGTGEILSGRAAANPRLALDLGGLREVGREDYEVRRELASGGMGKILDAWDRRHDRPVAIKMPLDRAGAARRFAREMRITGQLQHPSIVPLYEAGRWPSGEPFFAMKLVAGEPLARVIERCASPKDRLGLLPHVVAVAEALAYAHERGVVHRDLKPSNVLVGAFGETVVIDWGLAKQLDAADDDDAPTPATLPSDGDVTVRGRAVGTPCYMPPEQARGEPADRRADVYALGALLYHVFCGAPPYAHDASSGALAAVLREPPVPLEERAPGLPKDLLAIVAKAMARDPRDRYASAQGLAQDLKSFATGRLVSAHAYSTGELVRRWVARHRAAVLVAAALVAVLAVTVSASFVRIVRERDRADRLKIEADRARAVAVTQRDAAERIVEFVIGRLKERLEPLGKLELLGGIGREVLGYYDKVASTSDDVGAPALARRATALQALGDVEARKLDNPEAMSLFHASLATTERALALDPKNVDARSTRALDFLRIGTIVAEEGKLEDALVHYRQGAAEAGALLSANPELANARVLSAKTQSGLGYALAALGDMEAADVAYGDEVAAVRSLVAREPTDAWRVRLAWALLDQVSTRVQTGRLEDALGAAQESARIAEEVTMRDRANTDALSVLGWARAMWTDVESTRGNPDEALRVSALQQETRDELTRRDPDNADWARDAAMGAYNTCEAETRAGSSKDAIRTCTQAKEALVRLSKARKVQSLDMDLMFVHAALGAAYAATKDWPSALASYRECTALGGPVDAKANLHIVREATLCRGRAAAMSLAAGDREGAEEAYVAARAFGEERARGRRADLQLSTIAARVMTIGGDVARARGDLDAAKARYDEAIAMLEPLARKDAEAVDIRRGLVEAWIGEARVLRAQSDDAGARGLVAKGLASLDAWRASPLRERRAVYDALAVEARP